MKQGLKLKRKQERELRALASMDDGEIDFSDAPEMKDWRGAVVGKFYRPIKKSLTIRLDADVLAWLRAGGSGYQTRINRLLRTAMAQRLRKRAGGSSKRYGKSGSRVNSRA
jgi:uncharacterized protein (DUF4415 family)